MMLNWQNAWLALAPGPREGGQEVPFFYQMFPLIILVVIFYFLLIRPQQKKAREHAELVKSLKQGDKIITNGGIMGTIVSVKDKSLTIRSSDTKMEILKTAVSDREKETAASSD